MLAGVSEGYYARLEQGREKHPSDQVLNALIRVFGLDAEAAEHLHKLARQGLRTRNRGCLPTDDRVAPHLLALIGAWRSPAMILSQRLDVLAANGPARALFSVMGPETNLLRFVFLDPAARKFYRDWEKIAPTCVAGLRASTSLGSDDEALHRLVTQLAAQSAEFRQLWDKYDVRAKTYQTKNVLHPKVGELTLTYQSFDVNGSRGHQLATYQAEPGSESEESLNWLVDRHAAR